MTNEERDKTIRILQWLHDNHFLFRSTEEDVKYATRLAIQELQQDPCEDAISRQQCIDAVNKILAQYVPKIYLYTLPLELEKVITDLPSVSVVEKAGYDCELWQPKVENYSIKMVTNAKDAENYPISEDMSKGIEEINKLIFENGQAESEDKE